MVRKRSWPAVSHWKKFNVSYEVLASCVPRNPYNLQLDSFAIELDGSDFLPFISNGRVRERKTAI
jgi:hypothetical protein